MARSGELLGHSSKISNTTAFQCDNDDVMAKILELKKEKEKVQQEIDATKMEIDGWLQILDCSSAPELQNLMDDFSSNPTILPPSFTIIHPSPERDRLAEYCSLVTKLSVYEMLDSAQAYKTEEGEIFVKFPWRPPNRPGHECLLLLKPGPDDTYSVVSHNLPPTIPVTDLEKKYLHIPQGPDGVRRFVCVLGQYTKALYSRLQQIMGMEASNFLGSSSVTHNKGVTKLAFMFNLNQENHPLLHAEFLLEFHPLDIMPHTVKASPVSLSMQGEVPAGLQDTLDKVALRMKTSPFPQVILEQYSTQGDSTSGERTPEERTPEDSTSGDSTSGDSTIGERTQGEHSNTTSSTLPVS